VRSAAILAALALPALTTAARAFTVTPVFNNGDSQTWNATEESVIQTAINNWTNTLSNSLSNQNIVINFNFVNAGASYLAQWNGSTSNVPNGTSLYPWSPYVSDVVNINEYWMTLRDPSTGAGYNYTLTLSPTAPGATNWDGLTAVTHELGHALGFSTLYSDDSGNSKAGNKYADLTSASNGQEYFDQLDGGLNVQLHSTTDIVHVADSSDLMAASLPPATRKSISITDMQMLSLAYGYDLTVPAGASYSTNALDCSNLIVNGSLQITSTTAARQSDSVLLYTTGFSVGSAGLFDMTNHDMILANGLSLSQVANLIKSGRNGGAWTGATGITTTTAQGTSSTGLGYATAGSLKISTFDELQVHPNDVLIKYTYNGDANLDGSVDIKDLQILANNWQSTGATWATGDFNGDGIVDIRDLQAIANNWQSGSSSNSAMLLPDFSTVAAPEPCAALLATGLAPAMLLRRRLHRR